MAKRHRSDRAERKLGNVVDTSRDAERKKEETGGKPLLMASTNKRLTIATRK